MPSTIEHQTKLISIDVKPLRPSSKIKFIEVHSKEVMETIKPTLLRSFLRTRKTLLSSKRSRKWLNFAEQSWQCLTSCCRVHSILTRFLLLVSCKIWWTHGLRAHIIF